MSKSRDIPGFFVTPIPDVEFTRRPNGRTLVELDYPRLANDALIPFRGSITSLAALGGGPNYLNTRFGIAPGTLVTAGNIQSLTGLTPAQFITNLNSYLATLGPALPADFSPSTGFLRQDLGAAFQDMINSASRDFT